MSSPEGCPKHRECQKLKARGCPLKRQGPAADTSTQGRLGLLGSSLLPSAVDQPPRGTGDFSPCGRRCAEAAVSGVRTDCPPSLAGDGQCGLLSVQAWPEMRGQAQGWLSSGSLRLGHLRACRSCWGRREGGPRGAGACRPDRQPWAGRQALSLGMVASNQEQPTEDLSGTLNPRGGPARTRHQGTAGISAWPSL